jgi:hypothetical protein
METASQIITLIGNYLTGLDWQYIITFIILCYGLNHYRVKASIGWFTGTLLRTRYRVVLVGIIYGAILFFIRDYKVAQIEILLQSFIFAMVFHKLLVESLVYWLAKKALPESISKHLLEEENLKKIADEK